MMIHRTTKRRCGLTLLEIIVAVTILAALLVAMWRLIDMYSRLHERGEEHADRVGNVAGMMQQLEEDLRSLPHPQPGAETIAPTDPGSNPQPFEEIAPDQGPNGAPVAEAIAVRDLEEDRYRTEPYRTEPYRAKPVKHDPIDTRAGLASSQTELSRARQDTEFLDDRKGPSGLVGDETSLTLAQVDSDPPRQVTRDSDRDQDGARNDSLSIDRGATTLPKDADPRSSRFPVRMVRYWLVGAVPAGIAVAIPVDRDSDAVTPFLRGEDEERSDEATGFFREEYTSVHGLADSRGDLDPIQTDDRDAGSDLLTNDDLDAADGAECADNGTRNASDHGTRNASDHGTRNASDHGTRNASDHGPRNAYHLSHVEWAAFRYYDGLSWHTTWDSRVDGRLPMAVEMSLWLARRDRESPSDDSHRRDLLREQENPTWMRAERPQGESSRTGRSLGERRDAAFMQDESSQPILETDGSLRLPEVRQLVVLQTAVSQYPALPALAPASPSLIPPRRAPRPAQMLP